MKKIILGLSALACLAITSCSSDDNNKEETVIVESTAQKIVGNWKYITGIVIIEGETRIEDLKVEGCDYDYLNLKPDGSKDDVFHDAEDNCATENFVKKTIQSLQLTRKIIIK